MIEFVLLGASAVLAAMKVTGKGPLAHLEWWQVAVPAGAYAAFYVLTNFIMSSGTV